MSLKITNFEYMNEHAIDENLQCVICMQPFLEPIQLICRHIFCKSCAETWFENKKSCPTCRCRNRTGYFTIPQHIHALDTQLNRLLVRCLQCGEKHIQRQDFNKHIQQCTINSVSATTTEISIEDCSINREFTTNYRHVEHAYTSDNNSASRSYTNGFSSTRLNQYELISLRQHERATNLISKVAQVSTCCERTTNNNRWLAELAIGEKRFCDLIILVLAFSFMLNGVTVLMSHFPYKIVSILLILCLHLTEKRVDRVRFNSFI